MTGESATAIIKMAKKWTGGNNYGKNPCGTVERKEPRGVTGPAGTTGAVVA